MKTIYIDSDFKCHVTDDGTMTAIETDFFDNKCDVFIEGYCYDIKNSSIYPWKPYIELDYVQRKYEQQKLAEYETMQEELNTSYIEGVNSI